MSSETFHCPPQIHLEQEDPLNLDTENDKIEGSQGSEGHLLKKKKESASEPQKLF